MTSSSNGRSLGSRSLKKKIRQYLNQTAQPPQNTLLFGIQPTVDTMNGSLACAGLEKKTGRGSKISHAAVIIYCVRHYELISLIVLSEISSIIRKIFHNHQNFIVRRKVVALVGSVDLK